MNPHVRSTGALRPYHNTVDRVILALDNDEMDRPVAARQYSKEYLFLHSSVHSSLVAAAGVLCP